MSDDLSARPAWKRSLATIWLYRGPLSIAVAAAFLLFTSDQFREIFLRNVEHALELDNGIVAWTSFNTFLLLYLPILAVSFLVFYLRLMVYQLHRCLPDKGDPPGFVTLALCGLPQIAMLFRIAMLWIEADGTCALVPAIGARQAFFQTANIAIEERIPCAAAPHLMTLGAVILLFVGFSLMFATGLKTALFQRIGAILHRCREFCDEALRTLAQQAGVENGDRLIYNVFWVGAGAALWYAVPILGLLMLILWVFLLNARNSVPTFFIATVVLILGVGAMIVDAGTLSPLLGPLPIMALFCSMLAVISLGATYLEERHQFPVTIPLVGILVGFSYFDLNDNHHIRLVERPTPEYGYDQTPSWQSNQPYTELERAFLNWLDAREDYVPGAREPYKVFLGAAQGGGLYAAYHSASFLARLQDQAPRFSKRLFALSGVSGGAVGVTVFGSLMRDYPVPAAALPEACEKHARPTQTKFYKPLVDCILRNDFLSPVGGAMLFPDFLARFSPVPVPPADRAKALEVAFERAYDRALLSDRSEGLERTIFDHWDPTRDAPLLLLNVTDVSAGTRVVASSGLLHLARGIDDRPDSVGEPVDFAQRDRLATFRQVTGCAERAHACAVPRLSTAMVLSARFPVVTPAGSVMLPACGDGAHPMYCDPDPQTREGSKARFVDGGYFENSGLDTIADLIQGLQRVRRERNIEFVTLVFDFPAPTRPNRSYGIGELASPVRALNASRSARIIPARQRVMELRGVTVVPVSLDNRRREFTLGWLLSDQTFNRIDADIYNENLCRSVSRDLSGKSDTFLIRRANCMATARIVDEVNDTRVAMIRGLEPVDEAVIEAPAVLAEEEEGNFIEQSPSLAEEPVIEAEPFNDNDTLMPIEPEATDSYIVPNF